MFDLFWHNGDNRRMFRKRIAEHQWQKLYTFLQGDTLLPTQGKRKSVAVSLRQFTGYCTPAPSGVNCQRANET